MTKQIVLAGGCFWGVEHYIGMVPGVLETTVGYANGHTERPTYKLVCAGGTGFAEAVRVRYDGAKLGLSELLDLFYEVIDPTSVNKQGEDVGEQYRTGIYYENEEDAAIVAGSLTLLAESLEKPVAVEMLPLKNFYPAEEYHQKYLDKNPGGYCHIEDARFARAREYEARADENAELQGRLSPMQYEVTQRGATEPPFRNAYFDQFEPGIYVDVVDGKPLFLSTHKFESGCGWPSFTRPIDHSSLTQMPDYSYGRNRTEVRSDASGAHLGHLFNDGPADDGGRRYCINSASLRFVPKARMAAEGYASLIPLVYGASFDFETYIDEDA